ncbi:MAG TPA: hypothetical protein VM120_09735 [Bryobacteraceae bacterium]|nr:hypothetical protein [Bryobacteraceae bacterium]
MPATTIVFGLLLMLLGLWGYAGRSTASLTPLIPAAFGLLLLVCGALERKEQYRKNAMHAAAVLGVVGLLGSLRGPLQLPRLLDGTAAHPNAILAQVVMCALMLLFTVLCVMYFLQARKRRLMS